MSSKRSDSTERMKREVERQSQDRAARQQQDHMMVDDDDFDEYDGGINFPMAIRKPSLPDFNYVRDFKDVLDNSVFDQK